jgi:hypothetical protein
MRRVVVHEIVIGAGLTLLLVAAVVTGATQRDLRRFEREAAALRAQVDSLKARDPQRRLEWQALARQAEAAAFNARATLELRRRLWRPGGMAMLAAGAGVLVLGAGAVAWVRTRPSRHMPT